MKEFSVSPSATRITNSILLRTMLKIIFNYLIRSFPLSFQHLKRTKTIQWDEDLVFRRFSRASENLVRNSIEPKSTSNWMKVLITMTQIIIIAKTLQHFINPRDFRIYDNNTRILAKTYYSTQNMTF